MHAQKAINRDSAEVTKHAWGFLQSGGPNKKNLRARGLSWQNQGCCPVVKTTECYCYLFHLRWAFLPLLLPITILLLCFLDKSWLAFFLLTTQVILALCVKQRFVNPLAFWVAYFCSLYTSVGCLYARSSFLSPEVALVKEGDSVQSGMVLVFWKTLAYR